jgi:hypothetical protein
MLRRDQPFSLKTESRRVVWRPKPDGPQGTRSVIGRMVYFSYYAFKISGTTPMNTDWYGQLSGLSPFHAAQVAFEIRLEKVLTSAWEELECKVAKAAQGAPPEEKYYLLKGFFRDAENLIGNVVHKHFPTLLQVASAHPQCLDSQSPLSWTCAQIVRQVCRFLRIDEQFDSESPLKDDCRLWISTVRIASGGGWQPDDEIPSDFALPGWVQYQWEMMRALSPIWPPGKDDTASLPSLSPSETLKWVKGTEFWISKALERQIDSDSADAIIEAGKSHVSILDVHIAPKEQSVETDSTRRPAQPLEDKFIRETTTWLISFGDEICRVKPILGLEYIALLLENPGKPIRALELQTLAGGQSKRFSALPHAGLSVEDNAGQTSDAQQGGSSGKSDFVAQELLDDQARRELRERLLELERDMAYRDEIGDIPTFDKLQKEYSTIEAHLERTRDVRGRPRIFSGQNEKARTSITHALSRAYKDIQDQAPKIAAHLKSSIVRGSTFLYRDASRSWMVRRTP